MKKLLGVLVLVLVGGAIAASFLFSRDRPAQPPARQVTADRGEVLAYVRASGTVRGPADAEVAAQVSGTVAEVRVAVGDPVTRNQVVLRINADEAAAQLRSGEAALGESDQEVARQQRRLEGLRKDWQAGGEARSAVDDAAAQLGVLQAMRGKAAADAALMRTRLAQYELTAPQAGTVASIDIHPGEYALAGKPLLALTAGGSLEILARVDQGDSALLQDGMSATIAVDGMPDVVSEEHVLRIAPTVRQGGTTDYLPVWISVTGSRLNLRPNQQVDVKILTGTRRPVTRIPLETIVNVNGKDHVWTAAAGRLHLLEVKTGTFGDRYVEIASGLAPGQGVIVPDGRPLNEGDAIRVAGPGP